MSKKIAIIGAGPSGSSLAIRLASRGFAVALIERETFPRHKLCGEFISPECIDHFARLGVLEQMQSAGGDPIFETAFYSAGGRLVTVPSSFIGGENALSLSRAEMDLCLIRRAEQVGAEVFEGSSMTNLILAGDAVTGVRFRRFGGVEHSVNADFVIDATGRAAAVVRQWEKQTQKRRPVARPAFVGFKTHLKNVRLAPGRCEIYFFRGGYGGLTNIEGGLANLCFIVSAKTVRRFSSNADEIVRRLVRTNLRARTTLADAIAAREWLAVPLGDYGMKELHPARGLFCVGDSAAFIDPFTGSGMLLALESAELLSEAITAHADCEAAVADQYAAQHKSRFTSRLRTAAVLRRAAFVPALADSAIRVAGASIRVTELIARLTRRRPAAALSKR